jgi:cysteine desulfurase / selenocysteine lyase
MNGHPASEWRELFVGVEREVPTLSGLRRYINFDNAASTPALRSVRDTVNAFLEWYASVHRGQGFKSRLSTQAYEDARAIVAEFVGADSALDEVIFVKHTTAAVNKLSRRLPLTKDAVVLVSIMEHHSNLLPWRERAHVETVEVGLDGRLDLDDLERKLRQHAPRVVLVALSGASNVTGFVNPVHEAARLTHRYGAHIFVDAAQLAPHRAISMRPHHDSSHLDFVAFSAHKLYAPYGSGALIGPRAVFANGVPDQVGGGTVEIVTRDEVVWTDGPDRDEAGSPNVVGAVALAAACQALQPLSMDRVACHERILTGRLLRGLANLPDVEVYGSADPAALDDRLGVVAFNVRGVHGALVAAALAWEWAVGVRHGCFCAHPYVLDLLHVSPKQAHAVRQAIEAGDRRAVPGAVRVSFAPYNTEAEVDLFITALGAIAAGRFEAAYAQERATGEFAPVGGTSEFAPFFSLAQAQGVPA